MPSGIYVRTKPIWNKGLKTGFIPKTAFKEGFIPWNKGLILGKNPEHSKFMTGRKLTEEHKKKIALNSNFQKREKHPFWKGGISNKPYSLDFNDELKCKIRERDSYQCKGENCLMTEEEHLIVYGMVLSIHHIDYNKNNSFEFNLVSLCNQCNARANFNREYWVEYFTNKLREYAKR